MYVQEESKDDDEVEEDAEYQEESEQEAEEVVQSLNNLPKPEYRKLRYANPYVRDHDPGVDPRF